MPADSATEPEYLLAAANDYDDRERREVLYFCTQTPELDASLHVLKSYDDNTSDSEIQQALEVRNPLSNVRKPKVP